jgi:hypothetical protein
MLQPLTNMIQHMSSSTVAVAAGPSGTRKSDVQLFRSMWQPDLHSVCGTVWIHHCLFSAELQGLSGFFLCVLQAIAAQV